MVLSSSTSMLSGTFCRFSVRFCAVTTTSASEPLGRFVGYSDAIARQ